MAGSVNKVILIGNLGADPDVRTTPQGAMVATISIATSESFTNREGQRQDRTEWHRVVLWNKLAELAQRYLAKGRKVYIEGRLQTRSWDDQQSGQKKYTTEIIANNMTFIDSGGRGDSDRAPSGSHDEGGGSYGGGGGAPSAPRGGGQPRAAAPAPRPSGGGAGGGGGGPASSSPPPANDDPGYFDDDVPF